MPDTSRDSCIFCKVVAGQAPVSLVHEDEVSLAFMDIGPVNDGHVLVIPKVHYPYLADVPEEVGEHLFAVSQRVAASIRRSGLRCEGVNLFLADGQAAFQAVFHCHLHVFPRFKGDAFKIDADWSYRPTREALDATAAAIRAAYRGADGGAAP